MPLYSIRGSKQGADEYRVLNMPRCSIYRASAANIATATVTTIAFDTLEYDTDSMAAVDPTTGTRIRANTPGVYEVISWCELAANATGYRQFYLRKTSPAGVVTQYASVIESGPTAAQVTSLCVSSQIPLNKDDYVEVVVVQSSGGNLAYGVSTATLRRNGFQACLVSTLG